MNAQALGGFLPPASRRIFHAASNSGKIAHAPWNIPENERLPSYPTSALGTNDPLLKFHRKVGLDLRARRAAASVPRADRPLCYAAVELIDTLDDFLCGINFPIEERNHAAMAGEGMLI